jgi:hypothetical protein
VAVIAERGAVHGLHTGRTRPWGALIVALLVIIDGKVDAVAGEELSAQRADRLKAGYLLNFLKFVEWPAPLKANPLTVCFVGGQGVRESLAAGIENTLIGDRHLAVRSLSDPATPVGCDVLYVEAATMPDGARAPNTGDAPILTVSDAKDFVRAGGMIELFTEANHLRFNINVGSARKSGLRISASLLQLAATVEQATPQ